MKLFLPDNFSNLAITYKTASDCDKQAVTAVIYGFFGPRARVKSIEELDATGINSANFKVVLSNFKNKILVRRFNLLHNKKQIELYLELQKKLYENEVPVSGQFEVKKSSDLLFKVGNFYYACFAFIDAHHFKPSKKALCATASAVASMHNGFNKLPSSWIGKVSRSSNLHKETYFRKIRSYSLNDVRIIENKIATLALSEKTKAELAEGLPRLKEYIIQVKAHENDTQSLLRKIIHSDLHPHNILMKGDKVAAILDFEYMRMSEQARDLAALIYRFGRQFFVNSKLTSRCTKKEAVKLRRSAIEAYSKIHPLENKEIELLPFLIKDEMIKKILFVLKGTYLEGKKAWAQDTSKFLRALWEIDYFWS